MRGLKLGLGMSGSRVSPYAGYALALDFKNGIYEVGGVRLASLSDLSGYAFTDNVDNLPNITPGSGFSATTGEVSRLSSTANPVTSDQDFIIWAVANWAATAGGAVQVLANMGGTTGNRITLYRDGSNNFSVNCVGGTGGVRTTSGGGSAGGASGRGVILHRRRSGKDTIAIKSTNGGVGVGTESAATTFPNPTSAFRVGNYVDGTLQPNATIEGVFMRLGTFDDTALTALLTAA